MALALQWTRPARMQSMTGLIQALIAIGGAVAIGLAVLGSGAWWAIKGWREVAEQRLAEIDELRQEQTKALARSETERNLLRDQMALALEKHNRDVTLMTARCEALEGQLAYEQRRNAKLELRLAEMERRVNGGQHDQAA
jgi:hypothetical protein